MVLLVEGNWERTLYPQGKLDADSEIGSTYAIKMQQIHKWINRGGLLVLEQNQININ